MQGRSRSERRKRPPTEAALQVALHAPNEAGLQNRSLLSANLDCHVTRGSAAHHVARHVSKNPRRFFLSRLNVGQVHYFFGGTRSRHAKLPAGTLSVPALADWQVSRV